MLMRPSEALHDRRNEVLRIAADLGAYNVRVFGSVLYDKDTEGSDVDLLVEVPRGTTLLDMVRLQKAIEHELGVPVDVLTAGDLPPKFRDRVLREARPL
jgi:predicted nucleotidyltransferase